MSYLFINLYGQRERGQLDPDDAIIQLQQAFPEAIVRPGDQLLLRARQAEQHLDPADASQRTVLARLQSEARTLGPAYAFYIPAGAEPRIEGVIKRYQADFHSETAPSDAMRRRLVAFLRSLVPAGVTAEVSEEKDEEEGALLSSG